MRRLVVLLTTHVLALVLALVGLTVSSPAHAVADKDCGDFDNQAQAQQFFIDQGGPQDDPHRLDSEGDGKACESLPCPCSGGTGGGDQGTGGGSGDADRPRKQRAKVTKIVDGDTIKVRILPAGPRRTVRLIGIDTPEVYGGVECGGPRASKHLKKLLPVGRTVVLWADLTQANADRYGRILRYVHHRGRDLNRAQVATGHSKVYVHAGDPFKRVRDYRGAQASARKADRNLWKTCW